MEFGRSLSHKACIEYLSHFFGKYPHEKGILIAGFLRSFLSGSRLIGVLFCVVNLKGMLVVFRRILHIWNFEEQCNPIRESPFRYEEELKH